MFLTIEQIFGIKFILAGIDKKDIPKELNISKPMLSKLSQSKPAQIKLDEYFDKINPEVNIAVNKLIKIISENKLTYQENDQTNMIDEVKPMYESKKRNVISPDVYIALQERLLKSQEEKIKYLESERKRIIEKYGNVY